MKSNSSNLIYIGIIVISISTIVFFGKLIFQENVPDKSLPIKEITVITKPASEAVIETATSTVKQTNTVTASEPILPKTEPVVSETDKVIPKSEPTKVAPTIPAPIEQKHVITPPVNDTLVTKTPSKPAEMTPREVFLKYVSAAAGCDFATRDSILTEASKEILSYSCGPWKNEVSCYATDSLETFYADRQAVVIRYPFSQKSMPPFMFVKEENQWKIDFKFMADGIVFTGAGGCAYPWSWRNSSAEKKFCAIAKTRCL